MITRSDMLQVCYSAGTDAGNRNMRANARKVWSWEDWNAAAREYARVERELGLSTENGFTEFDRQKN